MRSRSVAVAAASFVLFGGGAVATHFQARKLRAEGEWYLARGDAQGAAYAQTLDNELAERQLATLEVRRDLLDQARRWQGFELLLIIAAVVAAFSTYLLFLFSRLRQELADVENEASKGEGLSG
ncbi:MAG: hypothetical protein ACOZIN_07785 [Myxococcota bacterium]